MMSAVNEQKPISPENLLKIFLAKDFQEQECQDEGQRIQTQKQNLKRLIIQYRKQLQIRSIYIFQIQSFIQIRAKLRLELQSLRDQRRNFDLEMADEVMRLKLTPLQIRDNAKVRSELEQLRDTNCKMSVRLHEIQDYIQKMENKIKILEKENNIIQIEQVNRRKVYERIDNQTEQLSWRQKVQRIKYEQELYSKQLRSELKVRQQRALQQLKTQYTTNIIQNKLSLQACNQFMRHTYQKW